MSSKGIASAVESSTCCIFALKVVGDVLVIDVGYKMYLKLVSVGNKHALIVMPTYPCLQEIKIQFIRKTHPLHQNSLFAMRNTKINLLNPKPNAMEVSSRQILLCQHYSKMKGITSTINLCYGCPRMNRTRSKHDLTICSSMSHQCPRRSGHRVIDYLTRRCPSRSLNVSQTPEMSVTSLSLIRFVGLASSASANFLFPFGPSNFTGTRMSLFSGRTGRTVNSLPVTALLELALLVTRDLVGEIVLLVIR
jgi:hypothetical protein